jgi:hypothetical protein
MKVLEEDQRPSGDAHPEVSGVKPSPCGEGFKSDNPGGGLLMSRNIHKNTSRDEKTPLLRPSNRHFEQ